MAKPQHRTPEHRAEYKRIKRAQAAGEWLTCMQGLDGSSGTCLMPTRDIAPSQPADVAHDDSGTRVIGAAHALCNRSEAATRGNRMRRDGSPALRWKQAPCADCGAWCYGERCADCYRAVKAAGRESRSRTLAQQRASSRPVERALIACADCGEMHARKSSVCAACAVLRNRENSRNIYRERQGMPLDGYRRRAL